MAKYAKFFLGIIIGWLMLTASSSEVQATNFYISRNGNNGDGRSWTNAWNELDQINWSSVNAGDVISIDGGSSQMVYNSTLTIGKNGSSSNPIKVQLSTSAGHNGQVVIDGGLTSWPECQPGAAGNPESSPGGKGTRSVGMMFNGVSNITVDGNKWGGIVVRNHTRSGVRILSNSSHIVLKNMEIHNNTDPGGASGEGVALAGTNITLTRLDIHHNGQDTIQQEGHGDHINIEYSYLHEQFCQHMDAFQVYADGRDTDYHIHHNVIATGFNQGIFMGENNYGTWDTWVDGAEIHDNLLYNFEYGIKSKHSNTTNWNIYNNTLVNLSQFAVEWCCASPGATAPMTIRENIFYNTGGFYLRTGGGKTGFYDNCLYQTSSPSSTNVNSSGNLTNTNPQFVNPGSGNYALQPGSPCAGKGSSMTSLAQLIGGPIPTPTNTPRPTATPTSGPPASPTPTQPPISGLTWEAEDGQISAPFTVTNGYVYQTVGVSDPNQGGKAVYNFTIIDPGDYVIDAVVDAPTDASNSFFINIDGEPTNPYMIWDIINLTNGFETRRVSWRGNGTFDNNEFDPKVFTLSTGTHQMIIRGREANTLIDRITLSKLSNGLILKSILADFFRQMTGGNDANGDGVVNSIDFASVINF